MIQYRRSGSIFDSGADILVNPVNCQGVSGKGLALEFKKRFPDAVNRYEDRCKEHKLYPGLVWSCMGRPRDYIVAPYIMFFPTKNDWREPSKLEYIHDGLIAMRQTLDGRWAARWQRSVAIPALGCGLGGLDWSDVVWEIETVLSPVKDIDFYVYEPQ